VGVLVLVVVLSWYLGAFSQHCFSRWCAGAAEVGLLPVVGPELVGVDAAEHLVPSCSMAGYRITPVLVFWT
jgi:hypothetical protein